MNIPHEYSPAVFTAEQLRMTPAEYLAWSVGAREALNLSDEDFRLWCGEVSTGYPKWGTEEDLRAIHQRWTELEEAS